MTAKLSSLFFGYGIGIMIGYEIFVLHILYETGLVAFLLLVLASFIYYFPKNQKDEIYVFLIYLIIGLQFCMTEAMFTNKLAPLYCFTVGVMHYLSRLRPIKYSI